MIKFLPVVFILSISVFISCDESGKNSKSTVATVEKPESNFVDFQSDFKSWWIYHNKNIFFDLDFKPLDQQGAEIEKRAFYELLKSGLYLVEKKASPDNTHYYQLVKTDHRVDKSIQTTLKSIGIDALHNLKKEGTPFPEFSFTDINGQKYSNASIQGKTVILKSWFIGCTACIKEFPELNALVETYKDHDDLIFLSLAKDGDQDLIKFLKKKPFSYEVVGNQGDFMNNDLAIRNYPTHLVIDENGIIERVFATVHGVENYLDKKAVQNETKESLAPPPPGPVVL